MERVLLIKEQLLEKINMKKLPCHIAVIMDGNGRWAVQRGQNRFAGHRAGAEALRKTVEEARRLGISYLTVFAFSTENWSRPKEEVSLLMRLLAEYLDKETANLLDKDIRLNFIGDISALDEKLVKQMQQSMTKTAHCEHMTLTIAVNYGGRQDICQAARRLAEEVQAGNLQPADIDEKLFADMLFTKDMPEVDLLLRTSGEKRISNFLLWQTAYAEIIIQDIFWPDFDENALLDAVLEYQQRSRRFGKI